MLIYVIGESIIVDDHHISGKHTYFKKLISKHNFWSYFPFYNFMIRFIGYFQEFL